MKESLRFVSRISRMGDDKRIMIIRHDDIKLLDKLKLINKNLRIKIERLE